MSTGRSFLTEIFLSDKYCIQWRHNGLVFNEWRIQSDDMKILSVLVSGI